VLRHSLRARLVAGVILWSIGLTLFAHFAAVHLVHWYFDGPPRIVMHRTTFRLLSAAVILSAAAAMFAGFRQVRRGLSALDRVRVSLGDVRNGREARLAGRFPAEVEPLVDDLNALLDHREEVVRRALAKAGDLAHGLKTPLAVLAHEAECAEAEGHSELAATLRQQLRRMERQVEVHLAQARAAGAGATLGAHCAVRDSADGLARTLARLHAERGLAITVEIDAGLSVRVEREDLDEMLGNLIDNACKWARAAVRVGAARAEGAGERVSVSITVDDDGPGLAPELRDRVVRRGVRADESAPGSGLGLAIVRDLAELYGGTIALEDAPLGGLRARLTLPAA